MTTGILGTYLLISALLGLSAWILWW
jgi:hypothetical protein